MLFLEPLPVFFESKVEIKVEKISGAIIAGQSQSIFWLDTRDTTEQQTSPQESDLQEVFMIKTSGELDDETAESMESQIVTNQEMFGFFTNFDHWVDFVALSLWIIGLGTLAFGIVLVVRGKGESGDDGKWDQEPHAAPMADQTGLVEEDSKNRDADDVNPSNSEEISNTVEGSED